MNAKHTPGPWEIAYGCCIVGKRPDGSGLPLSVAEVKTPIHLGQNDIDAMHCNARLIAAAPDLLAALELIAESDYVEAHHIAWIAIAKAKGE